MKHIDGIVQDFGRIVSESEEAILREWVEGEISSETSITDRFLESLKTRLTTSEYLQNKGISIQAKTLSDRGLGSEESIFGADFAIILNINLHNYQLKKGFLCQAKLEKNDFSALVSPYVTTITFNRQTTLNNLKKQTEKMLQISPDSFVIVYSSKSFLIVPAISINSLTSLDTLYAKRTKDFFKEFLMCFIGDRNISLDTNNWSQIKETTRKILEISITNAEKPKGTKTFPPGDLGSNGRDQIKMIA